MPLDPSGLASSLEDIFKAHPRTSALAAQRWAQAYASYAAGATSPTGGTPTNLDASLPVLQSALEAAFGNPRSPAPQTAQAIGTALVAYWVPILWVGPAMGTVLTSAPAGPAAAAALVAAWAGLTASRASAGQAAQQIAAALDAATHLVIVLDVLPFPLPPVVGPIL